MMLGSSLQSLVYLLLLASCYFISLSALKGVRIKLKKEKSKRGGTLPDAVMKVYAILTNERIITQAMMARMLVIGLAVGFVAGYNGKVLQHYRSVDTLYALHILGNNGFDSYDVEDKTGKQYTLKFCSYYIPQFEDDSFLEWITYEQTPACINIKDRDLGFKVRRNHGVPVKFSQIR